MPVSVSNVNQQTYQIFLSLFIQLVQQQQQQQHSSEPTEIVQEIVIKTSMRHLLILDTNSKNVSFFMHHIKF